MKNFRFESISLLSQGEKRARKVTFHHRLNLIVGRNHTGKSTLIKSIFLAFGARPEGDLDRWDENAVALVAFSIDEKRYNIVQQQSFRALFSDDGGFLFSSGSASGWGNKFAEITGFNLVLTDKSQSVIAADARAFFGNYPVDKPNG
jgi:AAA15 family ATPase/GTPase